MKIKMAPEDELQRQADALAADMAKTLNGILRRVAASLESTITAAAEQPERAVFDQAEAAWEEAVSDHFFPRVVDAYVGAAERTHLQLVDLAAVPPADVPFVSQSAALSYLTDTANRMVNVSEGTWARARAQLIEGFGAGESIEQLATRLQSVTDWSESRAQTVARTEIISASNAGALAEIQATGAIAKKTWLATKDDRTREAHRKADGQTVSIHNVFIVDGEALDFPGDPQGEPGNVINCRCTQYFTVTKSELQVALDDLPDVTDEFDPADFVDLDSLTAASARTEFRKRGRFDESKHKRGKGGRFAPKPGGGARKKIDYKKKTAKKAPPPPAPEPEAAPPKINYKKTAKKAAPPPPPAKKTAAPPPPAKKVAPAAPPPPPTPTPAPAKKSAPGKKTTSAPPPPEPDILDEDVTPTPVAATVPEPDAPLVDVTQDVLDNLAVSEGGFATEGDRVVVGNRAGTVRTTAVSSATGMTETMGVQFDDNPTEIEDVSADDAQVIDDADDYEDILETPFSANVLSTPLPTVTSQGGGISDEDAEFGEPLLDVSPEFGTLSPSQASAMQDAMLADDPWSGAEEEGLRTYTGDSYTDMNGCLRFDTGCNDDVEYDNEQATAAMRPLPQATTTFRGTSLEALGVSDHEALAAMVGATVRDPGFTSTSINPDVARSFGSDNTNRVALQIEAPAGSPAAYVEDITQNDGEYELVMPPSTRFEILEVVPPANDGEPSTVRLRVLP